MWLLQYMVKRKGLDFTEYGLVDARAAKRQRLNGNDDDPKWVDKAHLALFTYQPAHLLRACVESCAWLEHV